MEKRPLASASYGSNSSSLSPTKKARVSLSQSPYSEAVEDGPSKTLGRQNHLSSGSAVKRSFVKEKKNITQSALDDPLQAQLTGRFKASTAAVTQSSCSLPISLEETTEQRQRRKILQGLFDMMMVFKQLGMHGSPSEVSRPSFSFSHYIS